MQDFHFSVKVTSISSFQSPCQLVWYLFRLLLFSTSWLTFIFWPIKEVCYRYIFILPWKRRKSVFSMLLKFWQLFSPMLINSWFIYLFIFCFEGKIVRSHYAFSVGNHDQFLHLHANMKIHQNKLWTKLTKIMMMSVKLQNPPKPP